MKRGQIPYRIYFLGTIILLAISALVFRLWYVQIARGSEYTAKVASGSRITVRIPAVRGDILDRNGIPLVQNRASFDVDFFLPDMVRAYRESHGNVPMNTFRGTVRNMQKDLSEADVRRIVAEEIIPRLEELGVAQDYNADRLQIHYRLRSEVPYNYMQDMDFETMALLSERNLGVPGVNVTKKPVRQYLYGALGAHLLGYVGMPGDLSKLPDINKFNFYDPDMEGKAQIELAMNDYLKGTPGVKILQRDAKGTIIRGETEMVEPKQGANVYLTIDARIQFIVEQALRAVGRAAAVVVDPNNGDILAMASVPSYDPNKFIPAIAAKDWLALNKDETNPLLNRAISAYAPGSTYKIPIGLAGLRAGVGDRTFSCYGGVQYRKQIYEMLDCRQGGHPSYAEPSQCHQGFLQRLLLPIWKRCRNRPDCCDGEHAWPRPEVRSSPLGRGSRSVAGSGMAGNHQPPGALELRTHGKYGHRPGRCSCHSPADGHGHRCGGQRGNLLLSENG